MKKKLFLMIPLFLLFFAVTANAQERYNGDYFIVETPNSNWMMAPTEVEFDGETLNMVKTVGDAFDAHFLILSMKGMEDSQKFIEAQLATPELLAISKNHSAISETDFMGKDALTISFIITVEGKEYEADCIAVVNEGVLYYFMMYGTESQSNIEDVTAILESFQVK